MVDVKGYYQQRKVKDKKTGKKVKKKVWVKPYHRKKATTKKKR